MNNLVVRKIASDPVVTVHWYRNTHMAHVMLNGKEVTVYTFGDMSAGAYPNLDEFNDWLRQTKSYILETVRNGWY